MPFTNKDLSTLYSVLVSDTLAFAKDNLNLPTFFPLSPQTPPLFSSHPSNQVHQSTLPLSPLEKKNKEKRDLEGVNPEKIELEKHIEKKKSEKTLEQDSSFKAHPSSQALLSFSSTTSEQPKKSPSIQSKKTPPDTLADIATFYKKRAPESIENKIPSDEKAKQVAEQWKIKTKAASITLLFSKENREELIFLKQLAHAIDTYLAPCQLLSSIEIELNNHWDSFFSTEELKAILTTKEAIFSTPSLLGVYKEYPQTHSYLLQNTPLFFLSSPSFYLNNPKEKRSLWELLCQKIQAL